MYPHRQQCRYNLLCSLTHSFTHSIARLLVRSHALIRLSSILFLLLFFKRRKIKTRFHTSESTVDSFFFCFNIYSLCVFSFHIHIHFSAAVFVTILFHLFSVSSSNSIFLCGRCKRCCCHSYSSYSIVLFSLLFFLLLLLLLLHLFFSFSSIDHIHILIKF